VRLSILQGREVALVLVTWVGNSRESDEPCVSLRVRALIAARLGTATEVAAHRNISGGAKSLESSLHPFGCHIVRELFCYLSVERNGECA